MRPIAAARSEGTRVDTSAGAMSLQALFCHERKADGPARSAAIAVDRRAAAQLPAEALDQHHAQALGLAAGRRRHPSAAIGHAQDALGALAPQLDRDAAAPLLGKA